MTRPIRALHVAATLSLVAGTAFARADVVNVRDLGAKCDGVSDDAHALASASSEASNRRAALLIACKVRVASGVARISAPIIFEGGGALDLQPGGAAIVSGPLTAPLSHVFFENGGTLTLHARVRDVFPQWWGAKGDGETDDSAAINAAAAAIRRSGPDAGIRFVLPGVDHAAMNDSFRNFYLAASPIDLTDIKNIVFESRIHYAGKSGAAVTVGTSSTTPNTKSHFLVKGLSVWGTGGAGTTGILVKNATHSDVEIVSSSRFTTGVAVWADDHNYIAHNTFRIQDIRGCTYGLVLNSAGDGWINENLFLGGNISATSAMPGRLGIWITSPWYRHNNNTFVKPCLQGWGTAIQIDHGTSNSFLDVRNEASAKTAVFKNDSEYNQVQVLNGRGDTSDTVVHNESTNVVASVVAPVLHPLITRDFTDAYDDGSYVHVPGFNIRKPDGTDTYRAATMSDLVINADKSLNLKSNVTIGVMLNTRTAKRFMLTINQPVGAIDAIPRITCYDVAGRVLSGVGPSYVTSSLIPNTLAPSGSVYERSSGRRMKEVRFIAFRPEVAHAYFGIAQTDAVWGFNVYAIGDLERESAGYTLPYGTTYPLEVWGVYQSASPPTSCGWPIGTRVFNVDPATIAATSHWTCTSRTETVLSRDVLESNVLKVDDAAGIGINDRIEVIGPEGNVRARTFVTSVANETLAIATKMTAPRGSIVKTNRWAGR